MTLKTLAKLAEAHPSYQLRVRATRTEGRLDLSKLDEEVARLHLEKIGVKLTTLTVFGGALGIGLGFGLQKITWLASQ